MTATREEMHRALLSALGEPGGPALTLLTGPAGIGHTHLLRRLRETAARSGRRVLDLRLAPEDRDEPWYLAGRVLAGLAPAPVRLAAGRGRSPVAEPPPVMLARALRQHPGLVLFVDDAQWADPESVSALLTVLPEVARNSVRCVAAVQDGHPKDLRDGVDRLRADGLVRVVPLRPLPPAESDAIVHQLLQARPHHSLRTALRRLGRGRPVALGAAIEGYRAASAIRIVDRRAYLTDPDVVPRIPADHELVWPVRRLAPPVQAVARALAVLHPLGPAVPSLIARALNVSAPEVDERLADLADRGIARASRSGWRIRVPAVAVALGSGLGPYERRRLAQVAVEAVWAGDARSDEPGFLADQAALAGLLIDSGRALSLLRAQGTAATVLAPIAAARWRSGAAALTGDPVDQADALFAAAWAEHRAGRYSAALAVLARLMTSPAGRSPAHRHEMELIAVAAARAARDTDMLEAMAAGRPWLPDGPAPSSPIQAVARCVLGRWTEGVEVLASWRPESTPGDDASDHGGVALIDDLFSSATGRAIAAPHLPPPPGNAPPGTGRLTALAAAVRFRVAAGEADLRGCDRALAGAGLTPGVMGVERCLHDWLTGRWDDALDTAQYAIAVDLAAGRLPAQAAIHRVAAEILLARGRPSRAAATLEAARTDEVLLPQVMDVTAGEIAWFLGDPGAAIRIVEDGLAYVARHGLVLGADALWLSRTELAVACGDEETAHFAAESATRVASVLGTGVAELRAATARMVAARDATLAPEVLARAREEGRPYDLARTLERVVGWTGYQPGLLAEAYQLHGDLKGLLHRSRLRQCMRERGLAIPGRAATLAEGEQLLAMLVAEGLSNRELAAATQSSEKSVEGRLSRLFTRTGYRSRVELAAAVLVGDYQA